MDEAINHQQQINGLSNITRCVNNVESINGMGNLDGNWHIPNNGNGNIAQGYNSYFYNTPNSSSYVVTLTNLYF